MYAIIETGGKQYKVQQGDIIFVEKLNAELDSIIKIDKVLAVSDDTNVTIGAPLVVGASVDVKVLANGKQKKIIIFKYKPKKGYRKKQGHRQFYTKIQIEAINA